MLRKRRVGVLGVFSLVVLSFPLWAAEDYWKRPFTSWTRKEADEMLTESPWAKSFVWAIDTGRSPLPSEGISSGGPGYLPRRPRGSIVGSSSSDVQDSQPETTAAGSIPGEREIFDAYRVRLFSALPIRQAHIRKVQLDSGYDRMNATEKEAFDRRTQRAISLEVTDRVIVSLEFESNDRNTQMKVNRKLRELTTDQLKQSAYLITEGFERLELREYYPPSPDGSGAKFVFPRKIGNEPVVTPRDRELKFEFFVPATSQKLYIVWKVDELRLGDGLAF